MMVLMIHTLGNCHSTGWRAYGARSYATAIVATSAKMARKLSVSPCDSSLQPGRV